jgi:hypothetical protein
MDKTLNREVVNKVLSVYLESLMDSTAPVHIKSNVPVDVCGSDAEMSEQYCVWASDIIIDEGLAYVEGGGRFRANRKTRDIHSSGGYLKYCRIQNRKKVYRSLLDIAAIGTFLFVVLEFFGIRELLCLLIGNIIN